MKTWFKTFSIVGLLTVTLVANAQDKLIQFAQLPQSAQQFIKTYSSVDKIAHIILDEDFLVKKSYDVKMQDGSGFEFDRKGNWKEVDFKLKAVPTKLVPKAIQDYVSKSFPNNDIVKISKGMLKYDIELTNGLDLEFNNKGKFLRIDD